MSILERIIEDHPENAFVKADGFDAAIIGVTRGDFGPMRLAYSVDKCIEILMTRDNMTIEEATEFFDFNVAGAFVGNEGPLFMEDYRYGEEELR